MWTIENRHKAQYACLLLGRGHPERLTPYLATVEAHAPSTSGSRRTAAAPYLPRASTRHPPTPLRPCTPKRMSSKWEDHVASTLNRAARRARRASYASTGSASPAAPARAPQSPSERRPKPPACFSFSDDSSAEDGGVIEVEGGSGEISDAASGSVGDDSDSGDEGERRAFGAGLGAAAGAKRGDDAFVVVAKEHLVGIWLAVLVRSCLLPQVSDVRTGEPRGGDGADPERIMCSVSGASLSSHT